MPPGAGWNEEGQRGPKDDQRVGVVDVPDSAKTNSRTPDENQKLGGRLLLYRAGFPVRVAKDQRGHTGFAVAHTALATPFTVPAPSSSRLGIGPLHQVLLQAASLTCPIGPVDGWRAKVGSSMTHFYRLYDWIIGLLSASDANQRLDHSHFSLPLGPARVTLRSMLPFPVPDWSGWCESDPHTLLSPT